MAKALVFEGCPACEKSYSGLGAMAMAGPAGFLTDIVKGGAIGAGGVIAVDMILPKVLPTLSPLIRAAITGGLVVGGAYFTRIRYPDMSAGLALAGGGIVIYKIINSLLGRVVSVGPLKGIEAEDEGLSGELADGGNRMLEVDESPYGTLVAEELGQEDIILE